VTKVRDFLGGYRLARLIRAGHSCMIWEAVKEATGERFALKMLKLEKARDREELGYLRHEVEVAKDMHHPNLVRVYELDTQTATPFLVLELCSALNLKQILREGPDPIAHMADKIVSQAAHGLHYLHERGWVHCDVKPDNFLVDDNGNVKLIDFSIAQRSKRSLLSFLGKKQIVKGTRSYMSPEQIRGESLDCRSDVYSLGCVLFELFTGRPPYTGSTPNELLERHLRASVPSVVVYNHNVTRECADMIKKMMGKKRETRPKSMWDVLQAFRELPLFIKKPQPPKVKLSEMQLGPVTDADALKQMPQRTSGQPEAEE
jgi:serine/threonine protein kinase